jgi:hypothetical protein
MLFRISVVYFVIVFPSAERHASPVPSKERSDEKASGECDCYLPRHLLHTRRGLLHASAIAPSRHFFYLFSAIAASFFVVAIRLASRPIVRDLRIGSGFEFSSRLQSSIDSVSSVHVPVAPLNFFRNFFWGFE